MQQFILIRGHQGSGKTTFATQKINEFKQKYPKAHITHIENDLLLTDPQGNYHWSPEALNKAQHTSAQLMKSACQSALQHPHIPTLIINSNTNQNASACLKLIELAKEHHLNTTTYRLQNFFPNQHHVDATDVLAAYHRIQQQPLAEENLIPAIQHISAELQQLYHHMQTITEHKPPFNKHTHSHISAEYLRLGQLHFNTHYPTHHPNLRLLHHTQTIHDEHRFDEALIEMRGIILDNHNNIIVRPIKKIFTYTERTAKNSRFPLHITAQQTLEAIVRTRGFLGYCTHINLPEQHPNHSAHFNHHTLYSSAYSLENHQAHLTKTHCQAYETLFRAYPNHSFAFEIDQYKHLATLISACNVATGQPLPQQQLDQLAKQHHIPRPKRLQNLRLAQLKSLTKHTQYPLIVLDSASQNFLFTLTPS